MRIGGLYNGWAVTRRAYTWIVPLVYVIVGASLALLMRGIRFDDPYITYRYAENLAAGRGFVFSPGEATLITTAPLYALLLGGLGLLGLAAPGASAWLGVSALIATGWALWELGRARAPLASFIAGATLIAFPLVWLTVGFETPLFLAVALWAFVCAGRQRVLAAGVLLGIAVGLRGDGALVAVLTAAVLAVQHWRAGAARVTGLVLRLSAPALLVYAPLALWLTMQFGSPLPSTLQTKSAQAVSGLTGFYAFTTFPEGAWILISAYVEQHATFLVVIALAALGALVLGRDVRAHDDAAAIWQLAPVAWLLLHLFGYTAIGVAPYVWYYAPLVPGLAWLCGHGVQTIWRAAQRWPQTSATTRVAPAALAASMLFAALGLANAPIVAVLNGGTPPNPTLRASKVLPETKVDIYEQVGRWIAANTPAEATLGVTELGVMGYYAQRHTVDFLGLTTPGALADIRHGDFVAGLLREQPDYVAFPAINAIYDVNPQKEAWFLKLYRPVKAFDDARFWSTPMTVRQRVAQAERFDTIDSRTHDLGSGWAIVGVEANLRDLKQLAQRPLLLRVKLRAGAPLGNRTLRLQPVVMAGGDGLAVTSRLIATDRWRTGEERWVDFPSVPPAPTAALAYAIEASWLETPEAVQRVAVIAAQPEATAPPKTMLAMSNGYAVGAVELPKRVCVGQRYQVRLAWRAGARSDVQWTAFVHLRNAQNAPVAQDDHRPRVDGLDFPTAAWVSGMTYGDTFAIEIKPDAQPGRYVWATGFYQTGGAGAFTVDPAPHRTADGAVRLGDIEVATC